MDISHFPKHLTICGVPHVVKYVDKLKNEEGEALCGQYTRGSRVIKVATQVHKSSEMMWATLMHECLHVILYLTGQRENLNESREEALVLALENGLISLVPQLEVMRDAK